MWGAMGMLGSSCGHHSSLSGPQSPPWAPQLSAFCLNWETASLGGTKVVLSEQVKTRGYGSQKGAGTGAPWGPFWGWPEDK